MPLTELATICGRLAREYRSEGIDLWHLLDRMRRSVVVEAMSRSALFKGVEGRDLVRLTTRMTVLSEDQPVNTRLPVTWVIFAGGLPHVGRGRRILDERFARLENRLRLPFGEDVALDPLVVEDKGDDGRLVDAVPDASALLADHVIDELTDEPALEVFWK